MTLMTVVGAEAQTATAVPRLVVNVVVDQLRSDYLQAFAPLYGEDAVSYTHLTLPTILLV